MNCHIDYIQSGLLHYNMCIHKGRNMPEDTITVDTDDFILELSKSEYKKMKKICKKLNISLNYFIHEFDINVEAE